MGLSCIALESSPTFPTYPNRMPDADVTAGLVLPNAAVALLGQGGAAATLLLVFMAVTSASSSEFIAVSSIFTYDIYQTYINPKASGRRLINMAHVCVVIYAVLLACFSTALYCMSYPSHSGSPRCKEILTIPIDIGISMGYLYLLMGVLISSAVLPATLSLMWSGQNLAAVALSPVLGLACSLIGWLVTAKTESGELTVASTGANNPMLVGNVVALLSPCVFVPVLTYALGPQHYDWKSMLLIRLGDDTELAAAAGTDLECIPGGERQAVAQVQEEMAAEAAHLKRSVRIAGGLTVFLTIALLVLWPMPMFGSGYVFSKPFFTGWVVVGIMWLFFSAGCVGLFPLWEGRKSIARTFTLLGKELMGKKVDVGRRASVVEGVEKGGHGKNGSGEGSLAGDDEKIKAYE